MPWKLQELQIHHTSGRHEISLGLGSRPSVCDRGTAWLTLPFGKLAAEVGIPAIMWAFVISCGAGTVLLGALLMLRHTFPLSGHRLRYFFVTAAVSYALPNLLMFSAMPHLGAGYTGIMFTLSPVITLVLSLVLGVRRPNPLGIAGIVTGFVGALMVASTRGEAGQPADMIWVVAGLLIPVSLAAGNIYRTVDWPAQTGPIALASGSHLDRSLRGPGISDESQAARRPRVRRALVDHELDPRLWPI